MNYLDFSFKARYFDNGISPENTNELWFVVHGYGQLAQFFIKKFEYLKQRGIRVVAPEGLHRFYLKESRGRVGASWMTSEDRLTDIGNYLNYLKEVYRLEVSKFKKIPKISILGFSQGSATACRWVSTGHISFDNLILWAGLFPPDLNFEISTRILANKKVIFVYGTKDEYLSDDRFNEMNELSDKLNVSPQVIKFEGGHTIEDSALKNIIDTE